jgi:hypothetical protein
VNALAPVPAVTEEIIAKVAGEKAAR